MNPGLFGQKNRVFSVERNFFPLAAAFFSQYSCMFGRNSAFGFVFVNISGGLCKTKKLLLCVSSEKRFGGA